MSRAENFTRLIADRCGDSLDAAECAALADGQSRYVVMFAYRDVPSERQAETDSDIELRGFDSEADARADISREFSIWGSDADNVCEEACIIELDTGEQLKAEANQTVFHEVA